MKNKNKIKVPAYKFGDATDSEMAGLVAYNNGVAYNPLLSSITRGIAPNNPNNLKLNVATNTSSFDASGAVSQLPQAVELLSNPFNTSTATSDSEAAVKSLTDIAKGALIGMAVGGPIGAGVGALVGSIGSRGRKAGMTSFTDYDEGTLGTGFTGLFSNRSLKRRRERIKANAFANRNSVRGTAYLQDEAAEDNAFMNQAVLAEYGGDTSGLAYVDDGELIQTPDGQMTYVQEQGKPTDSNLVSLPDGSRVLSDTIKFPGTKKTIAQIGKEMMTSKKSKFNDKYAENANKLNEMNNQMIYDKLFDIQEQIKLQLGIQPKVKSVDAFIEGGEKKLKKPIIIKGYRSKTLEQARDYYTRSKYDTDTSYVNGDTGWPTQFNPVDVDRSGKYPSRYGVNKVYPVINQYELYPKSTALNVSTTTTNDNSSGTYTSNRYIDGKSTNIDTTTNNIYTTTNSTNSGNKTNTGNNKTSNVSKVNTNVSGTKSKTNNQEASVTVKPKTATVSTKSVESTPTKIIPKYHDRLKASIKEAAGIPKDAITNTSQQVLKLPLNSYKPTLNNNNTEKYGSYSFGDMLSDAATVAPIISNLFGGNAEEIQAQYNPYADIVRNTMARRRFNIDPALHGIHSNRAITNYNISQLNTNTGAGMAQRLQTAANLDRALTDLYSQESNINNQYLGDYANTLNNLGQQYVTATNLAAEQNAQNRAADRKMRGIGLSQLSQYAQNRQMMRNQAMNDKAMLGLYENFLKSGYSDQDVSRFKHWINKGGMRYAG